MTDSRIIDQPQPGFFRMRLVRGGPFVGGELRHGPSRETGGGIMEERSWFWETWIDGRIVRPPSPDPTAAGVWRLWLAAERIDEPTYRFLIADAEWCRAYAQQQPKAEPAKKRRVTDLPPESLLP